MPQERSEFHFQELSLNAFEFLVKNFGFTCVIASQLRVRFESSRVYIEICHGHQDYEVAIYFGRLNTDEWFSFWLFLGTDSPTLSESFGAGIADTPDAVAAAVKALARSLWSKGKGIIDGDDALFERMKDVRWWHFRPDALESTNLE